MKKENQSIGNNQITILLAGVVILLLIIFAFLLMMKNRELDSSNTVFVPVSEPTNGYITQRGNLVKVSDTTWNLSYERQGASSVMTVAVDISESTFCKKSGKPILCSQLQNGHRVDVSGFLENDKLIAKEIDLLDEIKVEQTSVVVPQIQE